MDLTAQKWPDEDVLIIDRFAERVTWAKRHIDGWSAERRKRALFVLEGLGIREGPEQEDLFVHRSQLSASKEPEIDEAVFELLCAAPLGREL